MPRLDTDYSTCKKVKAGSASDLSQVIAAYAGEKPIWIPKGAYKTTEKLSIPTYSQVLAAGRGVVSVEMQTDDTNIFEASGNPSEHVILKDFSIVGRKASKATDTGIGIYGKFRDSIFQRLKSYRCGQHIVIEDVADLVDCWDNEIISCRLSSSVSHGVEFGVRGSDNLILGGHIAGAGYPVGGSMTTGVWQAGAAALKVANGGGHRVLGTVLDTSYYNLLVEDGGAIGLMNVNIDQSRRHGVYLKSSGVDNVTAVSIIGRKIGRASFETDNTYSSIYVEGHASKETRDIIINDILFHKGGAGLGNSKHCIEFAGVNEREIMWHGCDMRWGFQTSAIGGTRPTSSVYGPNETGTDQHYQQLVDAIIADPKNYAATALSGTKKLVEIEIDGVPYYFEVYPTKA